MYFDRGFERKIALYTYQSEKGEIWYVYRGSFFLTKRCKYIPK